MIQESIAILFLCLLLVVALWRFRYGKYILFFLPVGIIPLSHLIAWGLLFLPKGIFFGVQPGIIMAFTKLLAIVISCIVITLLSRRIHSKRNRRMYLVASVSYTLLLGWAYIFNSIQLILQSH